MQDRSSLNIRKHSTFLQLSHETPIIPNYSTAIMVQKDEVESTMNLSINQASTSSSTAPQKRKGSLQIKFYAVKAGHNPGVYLSWKECEQNISGFRGAACEYSYIGEMTSTNLASSPIVKSFPTREEADAYVAGRASSSKLTQSSSQVEKFYGVAKGRNPGVYTDWATAQEQITGWKFPKYKKFATREEAEKFVRSGGNVSADPTLLKSSINRGRIGSVTDEDLVEDDVLAPRKAKRAKATNSHEGSAKFGYDIMSDLEKDILDPVGPGDTTLPSQRGVIRIHTDGSSLSNGQYGARAGLGVYFGPGDPR
jgi:ribonuclease HI